jgi:hypothetical protein
MTDYELIGEESRMPAQPMLSRRKLLATVPSLMLAGTAMGQSSGIRLLRLNSFEMRVPDPAASLDFYQGLFGMPVQARRGGRISLRVGAGPQCMALRATEPGETPAITQIGYAVEDFDLARVQSALVDLGFESMAAPPVSEAGMVNRM